MTAVRQMLVVAGSRSLAERRERSDWAIEQITEATRYFGPRDLIVSGGAIGPDTWARELATYRQVPLDEFKLDGLRWRNTAKTDRSWWPLARTGGADRLSTPLARNVAMVEAAKIAASAGWMVWFLGLIDPRSPTSGTSFTMDRAYTAKLRRLALTYGTPDMCLEDHPEFTPYPPPEDGPPPPPPDVLGIDTETTGVDAKNCAIIDLSLIRLDPTVTYLLDRYETRIIPAPWAVLEMRAMAKNGYTPKKWAQAIDLDDALAAACERGILHGAPILLGHNVGFDRRFLIEAFRRCQMTMPPLASPELDLDTLKLARTHLKKAGHIDAADLGEVCRFLGIPLEGAHEAMHDCSAAVLVHQILSDPERRVAAITAANARHA